MTSKSMIRNMIGIALILFLLSSQSFSETWFVYANRPVTGNGRDWNSAITTITDAIDSSAAGDTLLIGYIPHSETVYRMKRSIIISHPLLIKSAQYGTDDLYNLAISDPAACIIDAQGLFRILYIYPSDSLITNSNTMISGFTFYRGNATFESEHPHYGGAIYIVNGASPSVYNCIFMENTASSAIPIFSGFGGAVCCSGAETNPYFHSNTFTNNLASSRGHGRGGAFYIHDGASPIIAHNEFRKNIASRSESYPGEGGGIYITDMPTAPMITDNDFEDNTASVVSEGYGGAVFIHESRISYFQSNLFQGNKASISGTGYGGSIFCTGDSARLSIIANKLKSNTASIERAGYGGGLYIAGGAQIDCLNNTISDNTASTSTTESGYGGAICVKNEDSSNLILITADNLVSKNNASRSNFGYGGAIALIGKEGPKPGFLNNILISNEASGDESGTAYGLGGAFYITGAVPLIKNNTLINNWDTAAPNSTGRGSCLFTQIALPDTAIRNNIFMTNSDLLNPASDCIFSQMALTLRNNAFYGYPEKYSNTVTSLSEVDGNPYLDSDNYELKENSPCIDAGYDSVSGPNKDLLKANGWYIDIGAIEFYGTEMVRQIKNSGTYHFGSLVRSKLYIENIPDTMEVKVALKHTAMPRFINKGISRWYEITCDHDMAIDGELTLSYNDSELKGEDESALRLWHFNYSINSWEGPFFTERDTTENWISGSVHYLQGDWIITDAIDLVALPLSRLSVSLIPGTSSIMISWSVESLVDVVGFQIWKSEDDNYFNRITDSMIPSGGNASNRSYFEYLDDDVTYEQIYQYKIEWIEADGSGHFSEAKSLQMAPVQPLSTTLHALYPNPFNSSTTISYFLKDNAPVHIEIYNVLGKLIYKKSIQEQPAGSYRVLWNATDKHGRALSSGAYFLHFKTNDYQRISKCVLFR